MRALDCIDLFAGAGGLSIGLHQAGFNAIAAVEWNADACQTYCASFPHLRVEPTAVQGMDFRQFRGIDLVAGGPPCQPFSSGGKRLGNSDQRDMMPEFIRAVREARPRALLLENVPGLVADSRRDYFTRIKSRLLRLGYELYWGVLNAADYGVPQKRKRLIVVGLLDGEFLFPAPTHGPGRANSFVSAGKFVSRSRIIGEANPSSVFYAKNPDTRPSPFDGHVFNGGGRPIDLKAPCHTILAAAGGNKTHFIDTLSLVPEYHRHLINGGKPRRGVVEGARRLTVEESALLQTFPRGMEFSGCRSSQYQQIGNAVPPLLAKAIGASLARALHDAPEGRVKPCDFSTATY